MGFLESIFAKFAADIAERVFKQLEARLDHYLDLKSKVDKRDKRALEIHDMIRKAQTDEERDVLLDMQADLFYSALDNE